MRLLLLIVALLAPRIASASDDAPWAHASCSEWASASGEPLTALHHLRAGYAALRDGSHEVFVGNEAYRLGVNKTEGAAFMFGQIHALRWRAVRDELNEATKAARENNLINYGS